MTDMLNVIRDYVSASEFTVEKLREVTGIIDLMRAWKSGDLKQADSFAGIRYEFHGAGIYIEVEAENLKVDVDFLPGGQVGGFDSWRIWQWVQSRPRYYPAFTTHQAVREALQELFACQEISEIEGTSMFCLTPLEDRDTHK
jgi:hypothetical protein